MTTEYDRIAKEAKAKFNSLADVIRVVFESDGYIPASWLNASKRRLSAFKELEKKGWLKVIEESDSITILAKLAKKPVIRVGVVTESGFLDLNSAKKEDF